MNTVFVAENILFKEDYWCRNCALSTFVAGANREFEQAGKYSESVKALLVFGPSVASGTDVYRIAHARASIHLNLSHTITFE